MKQRGYPDRRGMGAPSDFISETFVPSERHSAEQRARARVLLAGRFPAEKVAAMLAIPMEALPGEPVAAEGGEDDRSSSGAKGGLLRIGVE